MTYGEREVVIEERHQLALQKLQEMRESGKYGQAELTFYAARIEQWRQEQLEELGSQWAQEEPEPLNKFICEYLRRERQRKAHLEPAPANW